MLLTLEKDFFSTLSSSSSLSNPTSRILCSLPSSSPDGINPKHKERCCNAFVGKRALPETTIGHYPPSLHCFPKPSSLLVPNSLSFPLLLRFKSLFLVPYWVPIFLEHQSLCISCSNKEESPEGAGQQGPLLWWFSIKDQVVTDHPEKFSRCNCPHCKTGL